MVRRRVRIASIATATLLVAAGTAAADTLVLRSGRRIEGELVGVRSGTIEFETRSGWSGRRVERFDREEVSRIEIDRGSSGGGSSGGGSGWGSGPGQGPGGGMRERSVDVDAARSATDTGIDVKSGQEIRFEASGKVRWGPDRRDGPNGEGGNHHNPGRPMPNRSGAALIGRIGRGSDWFFIGESETIRARDSGRLYLAVNDDFLDDNSGSFRVLVYY
jgi:hypothetical protein